LQEFFALRVTACEFIGLLAFKPDLVDMTDGELGQGRGLIWRSGRDGGLRGAMGVVESSSDESGWGDEVHEVL